MMWSGSSLAKWEFIQWIIFLSRVGNKMIERMGIKGESDVHFM